MNKIKKTTVKDIDGNSYKTVKIGNQIWMAENLKVTHLQNGLSIPHKKGWDYWKTQDNYSLTPYRYMENYGAFCNYDNDEKNVDIYGRLYNWFAAIDLDLPPEGWRIPSFNDWNKLWLNLTGQNLEEESIQIEHQNNLGSKLAGNSKLWGCNCSKGFCLKCSYAFGNSGFDALPGGARIGGFESKGKGAYFWTTTKDDCNVLPKEVARLKAYYIGINNQIKVLKKTQIKWYGFSIRCIKN